MACSGYASSEGPTRLEADHCTQWFTVHGTMAQSFRVRKPRVLSTPIPKMAVSLRTSMKLKTSKFKLEVNESGIVSSTSYITSLTIHFHLCLMSDYIETLFGFLHKLIPR